MCLYLANLPQSTLAYSCVCSNGQQPNASEYSQTIPFFECTEAGTQCVNACAAGDSSCQSACRTDHPCGAQDPIRVNTSTLSTMAATTTAAGASGTADATTTGNIYTGFGSQSTGSSKSDAPAIQALTLGFGRTYGLAIVLGGIMAGFLILL